MIVINWILGSGTDFGLGSFLFLMSYLLVPFNVFFFSNAGLCFSFLPVGKLFCGTAVERREALVGLFLSLFHSTYEFNGLFPFLRA